MEAPVTHTFKASSKRHVPALTCKSAVLTTRGNCTCRIICVCTQSARSMHSSVRGPSSPRRHYFASPASALDFLSRSSDRPTDRLNAPITNIPRKRHETNDKASKQAHKHTRMLTREHQRTRLGCQEKPGLTSSTTIAPLRGGNLSEDPCLCPTVIWI